MRRWMHLQTPLQYISGRAGRSSFHWSEGPGWQITAMDQNNSYLHRLLEYVNGFPAGSQEQGPTPALGGPWPLAGLGAERRPPGCASSSRRPQGSRAPAFTWGQPRSCAAASKLLHTRFWNEQNFTRDGLVKHTTLITFAFWKLELQIQTPWSRESL